MHRPARTAARTIPGGAAALAILVSCSAAAPEGPRPAERSALERDPGGWEDLLADGLAGWTRAALPPGSQLAAASPWEVDPATGTLACRCEGIMEALLTDRDFSDGVFHVEWRVRKPGAKEYNGGVYVRTSPDVLVWHQAQVAEQEKRPVVGDLLGNTPVGGEARDVKVLADVPLRARPAGEWNVYEIECAGARITLRVNGATTATWDGVEVPSGRLGLQAEFHELEFRNVLWKPRGGPRP
jgi:hypothetical protein